MKRLLDYDQFTGIKETFEKDSNGRILIKKSQNIDSLLDLNTAEKNNNDKSFRGDMHKVASIPLIFIEMWWNELKEMGAPNPNPLAKENRAFFIAKINNSDFSKLRTKEGRV